MERRDERWEETVTSIKDDMISIKDDLKQIKEGVLEILVAVRRWKTAVEPQDEGIPSTNTDLEVTDVNAVGHQVVNNHDIQARGGEERKELKNISAMDTFKNPFTNNDSVVKARGGEDEKKLECKNEGGTEEEIKSEDKGFTTTMEVNRKSEEEMDPFTALIANPLQGYYYLLNFKRAKRRELKLGCHGGETFGACKWRRQLQTWLTAEEGNEGKRKHGNWVVDRVNRVKWGRSPILNRGGYYTIGPNFLFIAISSSSHLKLKLMGLAHKLKERNLISDKGKENRLIGFIKFLGISSPCTWVTLVFYSENIKHYVKLPKQPETQHSVEKIDKDIIVKGRKTPKMEIQTKEELYSFSTSSSNNQDAEKARKKGLRIFFWWEELCGTNYRKKNLQPVIATVDDEGKTEESNSDLGKRKSKSPKQSGEGALIDAWLDSLGKQEKTLIGRKPPVTTANSHLEGKVKLRGLGNDGPPITKKYRRRNKARNKRPDSSQIYLPHQHRGTKGNCATHYRLHNRLTASDT